MLNSIVFQPQRECSKTAISRQESQLPSHLIRIRSQTWNQRQAGFVSERLIRVVTGDRIGQDRKVVSGSQQNVAMEPESGQICASSSANATSSSTNQQVQFHVTDSGIENESDDPTSLWSKFSTAMGLQKREGREQSGGVARRSCASLLPANLLPLKTLIA